MIWPQPTPPLFGLNKLELNTATEEAVYQAQLRKDQKAEGVSEATNNVWSAIGSGFSGENALRDTVSTLSLCTTVAIAFVGKTAMEKMRKEEQERWQSDQHIANATRAENQLTANATRAEDQSIARDIRAEDQRIVRDIRAEDREDRRKDQELQQLRRRLDYLIEDRRFVQNQKMSLLLSKAAVGKNEEEARIIDVQVQILEDASSGISKDIDIVDDEMKFFYNGVNEKKGNETLEEEED